MKAFVVFLIGAVRSGRRQDYIGRGTLDSLLYVVRDLDVREILQRCPLTIERRFQVL